MQIGGLGEFGFSLLYFIFLIVPGFLGLKAYLYATREIDYLSRFDKLAFAAMFGIVTVIYPIIVYAAQCSSSDASFCRPIESLTFADVAAFPIIILLAGITIQSIFALLTGAVMGAAKNNIGLKPRRSKADKGRPWRYAFGHRQPFQKLTVETKRGGRIKGTLLRYGSGPGEYDLLVGDPEIYDAEGNQVANPNGYRYIHNAAISEIHFHDVSYPIGDERSIWQRAKSVRAIRVIRFLGVLTASPFAWVWKVLHRKWEDTEIDLDEDDDDGD